MLSLINEGKEHLVLYLSLKSLPRERTIPQQRKNAQQKMGPGNSHILPAWIEVHSSGRSFPIKMTG